MDSAPIPKLEARLAAASVSPVDVVERIDALNNLAWALRSADLPRANALATEARQQAIEHGYTVGQARAARTLSMTLVDTQGLRTIFRWAEEAKSLFDEAGDDTGRAASRDFLSSLYEHIGDLSTGLELAFDALRIARAIGDPVRQGYALSSVGGILAASGDVDTAVERLEEALKLFQQAQSADGVGTISSRLSTILQGQGRTEDALKYAAVCRESAAASQNKFLELTALNVMAEIANERGDLGEAEGLYRQALEIFPSDHAARTAIGTTTQVSLAQLLIKREALADAESELRDALKRVADNSISIVTQAAVHDAFATLCERKGELPEAIRHIRSAQQLRDQISQQSMRSQLDQVEMRAALKDAKKDAEIDGLKQDVKRARQLGQYTLERRLGEGGMGVVYRASHAMMRRPTAVKLILPDRADADVLARFEHEVQQTARLTHPNTITVFDYGRTPDGVFYYAMELLEGATTERVVSVTSALSPARVVHVLLGVTAALEEAHGIGLIHRDIKPANVFLCKQGGRPDVPKVLDFGLVKDVAANDAALTAVGAVTGTPLYMAPERITHPSDDDHRSDLYAVGALGYYLLTGQHVFEGANTVEVCGHHLHTAPTPPSERLGRPLPQDLQDIVLMCLAKAPGQRPQTATMLREQLETCSVAGQWTLRQAVEWWDEFELAVADEPDGEWPQTTQTIAVDLARLSK